MKYIPYGLVQKIKPKIIDDITKDDNVIGKIAGVNTKPVDYSCEKELEDYILGIKRLGLEGFNRLYLEEHRNIPKESITYMEKKLALKIALSEEDKINYIPLVIKKVYNLLGEELDNKEFLVISENKEISKLTIKRISKISQFITMLGCDPEDSEEVYQYILEETGLSLFTSSNIDEILGRYSIIINLTDGFKMGSLKIKKNAIVFDLNKKTNLDQEKSNNSKKYKIEDFGFDLKDLGISSSEWLNTIVDLDLYSLINGRPSCDIKYLYIEDNWYSIKDYVNSFIRLKGKL